MPIIITYSRDAKRTDVEEHIDRVKNLRQKYKKKYISNHNIDRA